VCQMQTDQKVIASAESDHLRDSALCPSIPDFVETPAPSNYQVNQPEIELNCNNDRFERAVRRRVPCRLG
jgi:hypothetical protein